MIRPPKTMGYKLITSSGLMHGIGSAKTWVYARCSFNRGVGSLAFSSNSKEKRDHLGLARRSQSQSA